MRQSKGKRHPSFKMGKSVSSDTMLISTDVCLILYHLKIGQDTDTWLTHDGLMSFV